MRKETGVPAGYELVSTEREDGEWVTPAPGLTVTGELVRSFDFSAESGTGRAYAIRTADGSLRLLSERAAYAEALASLTPGDGVYIRFDGRRRLASGKTYWACTVAVRREPRH